MNKNTLKQIILAINESSLESQSREELIHRVKEKTQLARTTILQAIDLLYQQPTIMIFMFVSPIPLCCYFCAL